MERQWANWGMVEPGWKTHALGEGRKFGPAREAIETLRQENPGVINQDLPPFVIARNNAPLGPIEENDSVIFFNFRGDRAIEISRAFDEDEFDKFPRGPKLNVKYAGMMQYDGDALIPKTHLAQGAKRLILCVPKKTPPDVTIVMGVNEWGYSNRVVDLIEKLAAFSR